MQGIIQILYERAVQARSRFYSLWIDWRDGGRRFYFFRLVASFQFAEALLQQRQFFPVRSKNLSLDIKLFAAHQIETRQLRLQRLTDFFLRYLPPNSRIPFGIDS
ncbi:Uncharacterised protein [Salmonella enterica subsp. enterica]|uniref:Uncharacterized protein n=1 Tax=Salmonella enterica I TaxID=59201 RepID=A0A379WLI2_SALET|nr:Uncharacterised protein [Salmonella enterica subsp. enterica]